MDIIDTIKTTISNTAKKSNELIEITKLKMSITSLEADIARLMRDIGELIYEDYKTDSEGTYEEMTEEMTDICKQIEGKYADIDSVRASLRKLRKLKLCKSCGNETEPEATFCSRCGQKF